MERILITFKKNLSEKDFAKTLYHNIKERFVSRDIVSAFKIFSKKNILIQEEESVDGYGREEIEILIEHYGEQKMALNRTHTPIISAIEMRNEWRIIKSVIRKNHKTNELKEIDFWILIYELYNQKYSNLCKLVMIKLLMPMTTVSCERGFSALNFVKNEYRSRLSEDNLDKALRIAIEGPALENFDFADTYSYWRNKHPFFK